MITIENDQTVEKADKTRVPKHRGGDYSKVEKDLAYVAGQVDKALTTGKLADPIIDRQARFMDLSPTDERTMRLYARLATKQAAKNGTLVTPSMVAPTPAEKTTTVDHVSHFAG